ncbi:MAG: hypothetical protein MUO63_05365 [Desulfobulbaceae bacterium]|nr:hypothetical protein [Desulfobulbaceae bacterium]
MKPRNNDVKEQIRKLTVYLTNNTHRIDYKHNQRGGNAIGSGGIESANKFVCHVRLKRSGAWWLKENGNSMLALRCSIVNGTLNDASNHTWRGTSRNILVWGQTSNAHPLCL